MTRHLLLAVWLVMAGGWMVEAGAQKSAGGAEKELNSTDLEIQKYLDKNLPRLRNMSRQKREDALVELHEELMTAANIRNEYPQGELRKRLTQELIRLYRQTKDRDFSHRSIRLRLIYEIVRYGDDEAGKSFVLGLLETGSNAERSEIFKGLGSPGGIGGDAVYNKIADLAKRGIIKQEIRTALLARVDKNRALVELLSEIDSVQDKAQFLSSARTLQNRYRRPQDYKRIFPRLKTFGLHQRGSFKGGNGLFWIDAELLTSYIDTAKGPDLILALEIMTADSTLCAPAAVPVLITKLRADEAQVRAYAATALGKAVEDTRVDSKIVKAALKNALGKEVNQQSAEAMNGALAYINIFEKALQRNMDRIHQK